MSLHAGYESDMMLPFLCLCACRQGYCACDTVYERRVIIRPPAGHAAPLALWACFVHLGLP